MHGGEIWDVEQEGRWGKDPANKATEPRLWPRLTTHITTVGSQMQTQTKTSVYLVGSVGTMLCGWRSRSAGCCSSVWVWWGRSQKIVPDQHGGIPTTIWNHSILSNILQYTQAHFATLRPLQCGHGDQLQTFRDEPQPTSWRKLSCVCECRVARRLFRTRLAMFERCKNAGETRKTHSYRYCLLLSYMLYLIWEACAHPTKKRLRSRQAPQEYAAK